MSNKFLLKFMVAFGVLAALLIFLGANYVPRISALSSAKENAVDAAKNAGFDYIEQNPSIVAKPVDYAGAEVISANMKLAPVFDATGVIVSDPTGTILSVIQSVDMAIPAVGSEMKIAPVFDNTGVVVSDPTGTLLSTNHSGDMAVPAVGSEMKIAPVFDITGAIVSDPTGTILSANHPGDMAVTVLGTDMKIAPVFDAAGAIVSDPTGTILSVIHP